MTPEEKARILKELGSIPEELYDELITDFRAQLEAQISAIEKCIADHDFAAGRLLAHSLKGASANLRIYKISDCAKVLEEGFKSDKAEGILLEGLLALKDTYLKSFQSDEA